MKLRLQDIYLHYHGLDGNPLAVPLADILETGIPINPETGDELRPIVDDTGFDLVTTSDADPAQVAYIQSGLVDRDRLPFYRTFGSGHF